MSRVTEDQIERYLGTFGPSEFDSIKDIRDYFSPQTLQYMFGPARHRLDFHDRQDVMERVIELWEESHS